MTKHGERTFRERVKKILESKGWMVFTLISPVRTMIKNGRTIWIPSRGQLFDLIAMKNQMGVPIEVKGMDTYYPKSQLLKQKIEAEKTSVYFACLRQSKKRGKIKLSFVDSATHIGIRVFDELREDLKEYLEEDVR